MMLYYKCKIGKMVQLKRYETEETILASIGKP